ncbi:MAG: hypothetical protein IT428_21445 [Planctomycetaceae bacterium]|nr:hypothetical protein [Planctomycetaceae bacterium]
MLEWDRSHKYELVRFFTEVIRITIHFRDGVASIAEMRSLRRALPEYRNMPPAEFRERLRSIPALDLGELPGQVARSLISQLRQEGLQVVSENASRYGYLPYDVTTGAAWLIEDEMELQEIVNQMLAEGIPVRSVEG